MVVLLNENACGGIALKKWNRIENEICNRFGNYIIVKCDENSIYELKDQLEKGCKQFIAAGGDGTVNYLLNALSSILEERELKQIKFGAIGLGSSNDFHKPSQKQNFIYGIPCRLNFENTVAHDLGVITWDNLDGGEYSTYWINNASVGVTAEANYFFNNPNFKLQFLKQNNTNCAILYASVKTIFAYKNVWAEISFDDSIPSTIELTNLGIVKNPNFSGSFCYDSPYTRNSGMFFTHICEGMTTAQTLRILYNLSQKRFSGFRGTRSFKSNNILISSAQPFAVEYDGETIKINNAEFSLKKNAVQICA